jgi:hypothetical protein
MIWQPGDGNPVTGRCEEIVWPKSKLMQNVCLHPSDRSLGVLARLFLELEISLHQLFNFFTSSRRNVTVTIIRGSIAPSHAVIVPSFRLSPGLQKLLASGGSPGHISFGHRMTT